MYDRYQTKYGEICTMRSSTCPPPANLDWSNKSIRHKWAGRRLRCCDLYLRHCYARALSRQNERNLAVIQRTWSFLRRRVCVSKAEY